MVIGTLALLRGLYLVAIEVSKALKGDEILWYTWGICPSVHLSIRLQIAHA